MSPHFMKIPSTSTEWKSIADGFEAQWQFHHRLGSIDGKHVVLKCPSNSGSQFFNYKGTYSIVLLALVDASLKFTATDTGSHGRSSDAGIYS